MLSNYSHLNFIILLFCFFLIISAIMVILSANPIHSVFFLVLVVLCISGLFLCLEIDFLGILLIIVYVGAIAVLFLFVVMMLNLKVDEVNENLIRYVPILGFFFFIFFINFYSLVFPCLSYDLFFSFFDLYLFNIPSEILSMIGYVPLDLTEFFYRCGLIGDMDGFGIISGDDLESIRLFYYLYNYDMVVSNYFNNSFNINMVPGISTFGFSIYYYFAFSFILISIILLVAMMGPIVLTLEHRKLVKRQDIQIQVERDFSKTIVLVKKVY